VLNRCSPRSGLEQAGLVLLEKHLSECILSDPMISQESLEKVRDTLRLWVKHGVVAE
jgi:hypothetical protein